MTPTYERKDGEGFLNPDKREGKDDCWTGRVELDGKMFWLNVYETRSNSKGPYRKFHLKPAQTLAQGFAPKEDRQSSPPARQGRRELDDDLPF